MQPKSELGWFREWRLLSVFIVMGIAWGMQHVHISHVSGLMGDIKDIPSRVVRLESEMLNHRTGGPHKEALERLRDLEKDAHANKVLLQGAIDRLDRLLDKANGKN